MNDNDVVCLAPQSPGAHGSLREPISAYGLAPAEAGVWIHV